MSQIRRDRRPNARLVMSESKGSIYSKTHNSAMPLLIPDPSNKVNQQMKQIKMQFHKKGTQFEHDILF